jgi:lipopolysaccharide transport system permease protein
VLSTRKLRFRIETQDHTGENGANQAREAPTDRTGLRVQERELSIHARKGFDWVEILEHRELLYFLVWRDVKVRYKQTVLGIAWAILQPLFGMIIFTVIFGRVAKLPSDGLPYPLFVFAGLLPWTFFSTGVTQSGQSLVNQEHLITKVYFPRVLVPASSFGAPLVDLLLSFGLLAILMGVYGVAPTWRLLALPLLVLLTLIAGLGVGICLAALTVAYRDFRFVVPFMIQVWMFLSPVIYPVNMLPPNYRWALAINPMAGIIEAYRSSLLGTPWQPASLAASIAISVVLLALGLSVFRRTERRLADIV